jgi:hypothetical protein
VAPHNNKGGSKLVEKLHRNLLFNQRAHRLRVRYNENTKKFEILADRHILEKDGLRTLVIQVFHLEKSDVQFKEDENYRCASDAQACSWS